MSNDNPNENDITKNKVNLNWGTKEILGVKIDNLQMTANKILSEVESLQIKNEILSDKVRNTPRLYANAIIDDTSDFHNFWGDDEMHKSAQISRVNFLRQIAEHILVYCNANQEE